MFPHTEELKFHVHDLQEILQFLKVKIISHEKINIKKMKIDRNGNYVCRRNLSLFIGVTLSRTKIPKAYYRVTIYTNTQFSP